MLPNFLSVKVQTLFLGFNRSEQNEDLTGQVIKSIPNPIYLTKGLLAWLAPKLYP